MVDDYDDVVIGSSPLMLLVAARLAKQGHRVCLVERAARLGGAWQTAALGDSSEVEIACHLVEVFPGVYDYLEKVAGVPFDRLSPQPIRVHKTGMTVRYFSRPLLLASGVRLLLGYLQAQVGEWRGNGVDPNALANFRSKTASYFRHQLRVIGSEPVMRAPRFGYADFLARLIHAAVSAGVEFRTLDVVQADRDGAAWALTASDGGTVRCRRVRTTTSATISRVRQGAYRSDGVRLARRAAVVVDLPELAVLTAHTYVAFWRDPEVSRISRVVDEAIPNGHHRFLVELRPGVDRGRDLAAIVRARLVKAGIVRDENAAVRHVGTVEYHYAEHVNQLPPGRNDEGFYAYPSMGNLAAGISAWLEDSYE